MRVSYASYTCRFFSKYISDAQFEDIVDFNRSIVLDPRSSFQDVSDFLKENSDGGVKGILQWRARLLSSAGDGVDFDLPLVSSAALKQL